MSLCLIRVLQKGLVMFSMRLPLSYRVPVWNLWTRQRATMEHITHFLASQHEGTVIIIIILVPDRKGHPTIFTHSKHSPTFTQKIFLSNSHSLENSLEASLVPEQKVQSAIHVPYSSGSLSSPNPPTWCHQSPPLSLFLLSKISLRQCVFLGL